MSVDTTVFHFIAAKIGFGLGWLMFVAFLPGLVAYLIVEAPVFFKHTARAQKVSWALMFLVWLPCTVTYVDFIRAPLGNDLTSKVQEFERLIGENYTEYGARQARLNFTRQELGEELRRYAIVGLNPPKHAYVSLRDTTTGEVLQNLHLGKHCAHFGDLWLGQEHNLRLTRYRYSSDAPGAVRYEFANLASAFCGA